MILRSARMRRWMLWAAPLTAPASLRWHAGGAAAVLALWLAMGVLFVPSPVPPRVRPRRVLPHRLFFSYALCVSCMAGLEKAAGAAFGLGQNAPLPSRGLFALGGACLSLALAQKALSLPLPRHAAWSGGVLLCAFFVLCTVLR